MNINTNKQKKSSEKEFRHFALSRTGTIIFTVLASGMVIFTVRIIFFGVLRKCYEITVSYSNYYLEFPYSFWRTFFSVWIKRGESRCVHAKNVKKKKRVVQVPWRTACVGSALWWIELRWKEGLPTKFKLRIKTKRRQTKYSAKNCRVIMHTTGCWILKTVEWNVIFELFNSPHYWQPFQSSGCQDGGPVIRTSIIEHVGNVIKTTKIFCLIVRFYKNIRILNTIKKKKKKKNKKQKWHLKKVLSKNCQIIKNCRDVPQI